MRPILTLSILTLALGLSGPAMAQTAADADADAVAMADGNAGLSPEAPADADGTAETMADAAPEADSLEAATLDPMQPRDAAEVTLEEFQWIARPIIVFADTPADPRFIEQLELLADRPEPLLERDVVIIIDTDPSARSEIRTALRPRGFSLVLMQKDGNVGVRRPSPRDVREIMRTIDNFQLRQEELRRGS